jgi:hypothetical protein
VGHCNPERQQGIVMKIIHNHADNYEFDEGWLVAYLLFVLRRV